MRLFFIAAVRCAAATLPFLTVVLKSGTSRKFTADMLAKRGDSPSMP